MSTMNSLYIPKPDQIYSYRYYYSGFADCPSYKLGFLFSVVVQSQIAVSLKRTREGTYWSACVVSVECAHGWAMADLSKVLSLNKVRVNCMESKTLKTRTKVNTVRGRPAVRELYERSIYEQTVMSELSIEGYAISNQLFTVKLRWHYRVFRRDRGPSRIPVRSLKCLGNKSRKLKEFVYKRIVPCIPKSSKLQCYIHMKVRKFTKVENINVA